MEDDARREGSTDCVYADLAAPPLVWIPMTTLPEVPKGVRPVVGEHLSEIEVPRTEREWRQAVNVSSVGLRRVRRRPRDLPAAPPYPKLFVVGCGRSGTSWVQ